MLTILTRLTRGLTLSLLLLAGLVLSACSAPEPPLKVGTNIWPGYESLYLARHLGDLDPEKITLVEKANATQVLRDFKSGQLDVAALTMDEALTLLVSGEEIRVIALMDFSRGADMLIARPGTASLAALQEQTIAVEKTAVGAILLQSALEEAGLKPYQVKVLNAPVNQHLSLWQQEDIAAVVTFEPFSSQLQALGGQVLFDSKRIPQRIMDVLVVRADTAEQRPDALKHLMQAHFSSLTFMAREQRQAAGIMAGRLKISPDQVLQSFRGLHIPDLEESRRLLGQPDVLLQQVLQLKNLMLKSDLLTRDIAVNTDLFDARFLPETAL